VIQLRTNCLKDQIPETQNMVLLITITHALRP
jgi:hypothetical protein